MNYFLKLLSALIGGKFIFTKKSFTRFSLQSECSNFNQCWRELGGRIALFGPALKNRHTLLFKSGIM